MRIISNRYNQLLERGEVVCLFEGMAGKLSRRDTIAKIKEELKTDKLVIPIRLSCEYGKNDLRGLFYIYDNKEIARRYLPKYIFKRIELEKEEKREGNKDGEA